MKNLGLAADELALLPDKEACFVKGPVPSNESSDAFACTSSELIAKHRYPLLAKQPKLAPGGGTQRTVYGRRFSDFHDDGSLCD